MKKVKICGMTSAENIKEISQSRPDYLGFIFYPKSPRFVGHDFDPRIVSDIQDSIQTISIFVNETFEYIFQTVTKYQLDYVQLHGHESISLCAKLSEAGIQVIKALHIDNSFKLEQLIAFEPFCKYFLFDTKTIDYGGSGRSFNWDKIYEYNLSVPFFLSGGLGTHNLQEALTLKHPQLAGFDFNSRLEIQPGIKSADKVRQVISHIRNHTS